MVLILCYHGLAVADIDGIQRLLDQGKADEAYTAALQLREDLAGDPAFDLVFGLAALETNHPEVAVFAMERVLMVQPDNHRARLELARAHYLLGEYQAARVQFEVVRAANPPSNVREQIDKFIVAIDERIRSQQHIITPHAALRLGHDSNINSATADGSVEIPALGLVTLTDSSQKLSDRYAEVRAGIDYVGLLTKTKSIFVSVSLAEHNNLSTDMFDNRVVDIVAGPTLVYGKHRLRFPIQVQLFYVDKDFFRSLYSFTGDWAVQMAGQQQLSTFIQGGVIAYPDQRDRDADLAIAGASWSRQFGGGATGISTAAYYGNEHARADAGEHHGRRYSGIRAGFNWTPWPNHLLHTSLGGQLVEHDSAHPVFLATRGDDLVHSSLGWSWNVTRQLQLGSQIDYQRNRSNISIYAYDRTQLFFDARYNFR